MTSIGTINADHGVFNIVAGDQTNYQTNYHIYPPPAAEHDHHPVFNAPVDILSVHFTGRSNELDFVQKALSEPHNGVPNRCAVYGMPGIGKTQLLLRYVKVSWDQHLYSHIVWISAASVDRITQGISGILDLIEHPDRYLQDQTAKLKTARLWLERYEGGDWLLVFDNVQNETLEFLSANLPLMNERGNILFSTRTADVAELLVNAAGEQHQTLELRSMELQETTDLLFADAGIDAAMVTPSLSSQAEDLVKRVGRLPLAIVQAASFMKQTHSTLDNMLELYKSEHKIQIIQWENNLSRYEEISVARTILNQINELSRQSGNLENLLKLLSFLDPENIPVELIVDGAEARRQRQPEDVSSQPKRSILRKFQEWQARKKSPMTIDDIVTPHLSPELDSLITLIVSPVELQTAIQKLQSLSLVERRSHDGASSLWIHDLIQFMVREHARKDGTYEAWLQSSWSLVYSAFRLIEDPTLPQWWARCEMFLPHLQSIKNTSNDSLATNLEVAHANSEIAGYFVGRGRYAEAEALYALVVEEGQKHLGDDHPSILNILSNLADVYSSQGRYGQAEELHERVLKARAKKLGTNDPDTLKSVDNLASVYSSQGRYDEAEKLYKRALKGMEKKLRTDHPLTLITMNDLANLYFSQGRFDQAEELHKRALEAMEKNLGNVHPDTLSTMGNLAHVYLSQGRFDKAETLSERVLEGREKNLGTNHPDTLSSMNNLADVYLSQGRYDKAEELYKRALDGMEKNLGLDHPETLSTVNNLAQVYSLQERYSEAEALNKRALEGMENKLGTDHPHTLVLTNNLAEVYSSQGRSDKAEELHNRVLAVREKSLGTNHPDTLSSMNNLACVYSSRGQYDKAEKLYKQTLEGVEKNLGTDHPHALVSMSNLAYACSSQGRYDKAEELYKRSLKGMEENLGSDHPHTLALMDNLADCYSSQGRQEEAEELRNRARERGRR